MRDCVRLRSTKHAGELSTFNVEGPSCDEGCHENAECVDGVCKCREGFAGDGVNICKEVCVCRLRGDPILETYDNQYMLLVGTKKYTMTKYMTPDDPCSFNVEVKAGKPLRQDRVMEGATMPRFLDIEMYGYRIRLDQHYRVYLGNEEINITQTPYEMDGDFKISKTDKFVIFGAESCDINIGFYGHGLDSIATVVVPAKYSNLMTGLCGDCDGEMDDLQTKDGIDVADTPDKYYEISNSFTVDESYDEINAAFGIIDRK